jgi:hypothetical protein
MSELPLCRHGSFGELSSVSTEAQLPPMTRSIDIERTIWDPDYRRWVINQLSKQNHS